MARVLKEEEYNERRNEILEVVRRFVYTRGYEQISIQDILNEMNISKGAFYHYFDSKQALLEGLIDRMLDEAKMIITPILEDPHLSAPEKFHRYFSNITQWKSAQKEYMLAIYRVWYHDNNSIVRQKMTESMIQWLIPQFSGIIEQGVREGVFQTPYPQQAAEVVISILQGFGNALAVLLMPAEPQLDVERRIESTVFVYTDALDRVLGAPTGTLHLIDLESLMEWAVQPDGSAS